MLLIISAEACEQYAKEHFTKDEIAGCKPKEQAPDLEPVGI